jgi:N-carbamoylputrescine amidase
MPRIVRSALIQTSNALSPERPLVQIKTAMIDKHLKFIEQAAKKKTQILCLQELFYGPYFCAEQNARWYELTERVPDGPTTKMMQKIAAKHRMVIVVPIYEEQMPGVYFNTAAVIDADGGIWGSTASIIFRTAIRDFGRSFISRRAISAIRCLRPSMLAWAFTFAMIGTFLRARGFWV